MRPAGHADAVHAHARRPAAGLQPWIELLKLRIATMVALSAFVGALLAAGTGQGHLAGRSSAGLRACPTPPAPTTSR